MALSIMPAHDTTVATEQLLTFRLGLDEYGISILRVREIAEFPRLTPIPGRPAWMRGVMNLRSTVVPVVDLAAKLGLGMTIPSRLTCVIIVDLELEGERNIVALMVDAVQRVVDINVAEIQPAPPFGMAVDIIPGILRVDGQLITLLDLAAIVARSEVEGLGELLKTTRDGAETPGEATGEGR